MIVMIRWSTNTVSGRTSVMRAVPLEQYCTGLLSQDHLTCRLLFRFRLPSLGHQGVSSIALSKLTLVNASIIVGPSPTTRDASKTTKRGLRSRRQALSQPARQSPVSVCLAKSPVGKYLFVCFARISDFDRLALSVVILTGR